MTLGRAALAATAAVAGAAGGTTVAAAVPDGVAMRGEARSFISRV
jgi:hypothetical protein